MNRRHFLTCSAAGLAMLRPFAGRVVAAEAGTRITPVVGTQLYGWGQYYERDKQDLSAHLDEALSAIRDCGYNYAEGSVDIGTPANNTAFADRLRAKGMKPVSLYTGGRFHEAGKAEENVARLLAALRVCRDAGFMVIVCNPDPIGREKTDAELATQAAALKSLGSEMKKLGLRLGIHHHTPEMANGAREFHYNFRHTPAGEVDFCYDVHWVYRGGVQPMDCLGEYGGRVVSWHLRQSRGGIWWEDLAPGDIDYAAVAAFARDHGLTPRLTVELALEHGTKITRTVAENHRRSRDYVKQVFAA